MCTYQEHFGTLKRPQAIEQSLLLYSDLSHQEFSVVHCGKYVFPKEPDKNWMCLGAKWARWTALSHNVCPSSTAVNSRIVIMLEYTLFLTCKRVKGVWNYHYNPSLWTIPAPFNNFTQNSEPNGQNGTPPFNEAWKNCQKANSWTRKGKAPRVWISQKD